LSWIRRRDRRGRRVLAAVEGHRRGQERGQTARRERCRERQHHERDQDDGDPSIHRAQRRTAPAATDVGSRGSHASHECKWCTGRCREDRFERGRVLNGFLMSAAPSGPAGTNKIVVLGRGSYFSVGFRFCALVHAEAVDASRALTQPTGQVRSGADRSRRPTMLCGCRK